MSAKAGLEHRNYPYDLKRLKFTTLDMIPSLIPSKSNINCCRQILCFKNISYDFFI